MKSGNKKSDSLWISIKANRVNYLMVLPFALLFLVFTVIPVAAAIILSFTSFNMVQFPVFSGFSNYVRLFLNDEVFLICLKNTLEIAFITGPISYFACFIFAWLINELPRRLRTIMTFIYYAPSISGSLFVIFTWVFSGDMYGLINSFLLRLGLVAEPVQWLRDTRYILGVVMFVQIWLSLGAGFLSFIAGLQGIDRQIY